VTGLEVVGVIAAPGALALAAAVVYLVIRSQRQVEKLEGHIILAGTERYEAERRANAAETLAAQRRLEASHLRVALDQQAAELERERGVPAILRSQFKEALRDLEACSSPVDVREQIRRMLSEDSGPA
jgi:hypothetical protein